MRSENGILLDLGVPRVPLSSTGTEDARIEKVSESINNKIGIRSKDEIKAKLESRIKYKIRIYPLALWQDNKIQKRFISLFLEQNSKQKMFQLELGHCDHPELVESQIAEHSVDKFGEDKFGEFIEAVEYLIQESELYQNAQSADVARIVITNSRLPMNYIQVSHTWMPCYWCNPPRQQWGVYEPYRFFVVSLATFWHLHPDIPVEDFLLRQIQRICMRVVIPVEDKENRKRMTHDATRSCLFDFVQHHEDASYFTKQAFICDQCIQDILEAKEIPPEDREAFLNQFLSWLEATMPLEGR
jgi:hypothetical protein